MKKLFVAVIIFCISFSSYANDENNPPNSPKPMEIRKRKARPDIPGNLLVELGWNALSGAPSDLDIASLGSRTINFYYMYDIPIGKSKFSFMPGIGVGLDRYKFDDDITLLSGQDADGNDIIAVTALPNEFDVKKSQLITNYIDIPIEFRFYTNPQDRKGSFKLGIGGKVGMRFTSQTKLKYEFDGENIKSKNKESFGLNRFRYGVVGRIGVGGINFFYYQSLSELFESGEGPLQTDANNITVGISITGF